MTTEAQNKEALRDLLSVAIDSQRRGKDLCELRLIRTRISGRRVYLAGRNSPLGSCFDAKPIASGGWVICARFITAEVIEFCQTHLSGRILQNVRHQVVE